MLCLVNGLICLLVYGTDSRTRYANPAHVSDSLNACHATVTTFLPVMCAGKLLPVIHIADPPDLASNARGPHKEGLVWECPDCPPNCKCIPSFFLPQ